MQTGCEGAMTPALFIHQCGHNADYDLYYPVERGGEGKERESKGNGKQERESTQQTGGKLGQGDEMSRQEERSLSKGTVY